MFFKAKQKPKVEKSVGATLYPTKIVVETKNKRDDFVWYCTDDVSILPIDVNDQLLGETIHNHLNNSKERDVSHEQMKLLRESFKKITKMKTDKEIQ